MLVLENNAVVIEMNTNLFSNRDAFQAEIERAMKCVSVEEMKKSVQSFNNRVRKVENSEGQYINK